MKETDLGQLAQAYWQAKNCGVIPEQRVTFHMRAGKPEVRIPDQIVTHGDSIDVSYLKLKLTAAVVKDAAFYCRFADYVTIVIEGPVPKTGAHVALVERIRRRGLGLIAIALSGHVDRIVHARRNLAADTRALRRAVEDYEHGVPTPVKAGAPGGLRRTGGQARWDGARRSLVSAGENGMTAQELWYDGAAETTGICNRGDFVRELGRAAGKGLLGVETIPHTTPARYRLTADQREAIEAQEMEGVG